MRILTMVLITILVPATVAHAQLGTPRGRGFAVFLNAPSTGIAPTYYCDSGWVPASGGQVSDVAQNVVVGNVFSAQNMNASSQLDAILGQTHVSIQNATFFAGTSFELSFTSLSSDDDDNECEADDDSPPVGVLGGLTFGGTSIPVTGLPNQTVTLSGVGTLVINEIIPFDDPDPDDCETSEDGDDSISILHLRLNSGDEVIIGNSYFHFDDECCVVSVQEELWGSVKKLYR